MRKQLVLASILLFEGFVFACTESIYGNFVRSSHCGRLYRRACIYAVFVKPGCRGLTSNVMT